eukprot:358281-Chlamydomonas_euryale.AAC.7
MGVGPCRLAGMPWGGCAAGGRLARWGLIRCAHWDRGMLHLDLPWLGLHLDLPATWACGGMA